MDVRNLFIAGMIFASVIFTVWKLIMRVFDRKALLLFISGINDMIKGGGEIPDFKAHFYCDVVFGYVLAFRNAKRISEREFEELQQLIEYSRSEKCEINIDRIKKVMK